MTPTRMRTREHLAAEANREDGLQRRRDNQSAEHCVRDGRLPEAQRQNGGRDGEHNADALRESLRRARDESG